MSEDFSSSVRTAIGEIASSYKRLVVERQRAVQQINADGNTVVNVWRLQTFGILLNLINSSLRDNDIGLEIGYGAAHLRTDNDLAFLEFTLTRQHFVFHSYPPLRLEVHEDGFVRSAAAYPYTPVELKIADVDQNVMLPVLCKYIDETLVALE